MPNPTSSRGEVKALVKALRAVNAQGLHVKMAAVLYACNGLASALEFVAKIPTLQEKEVSNVVTI